MNISITEFRQWCLDLIRRVKATSDPITMTRRGKAIAQLGPPAAIKPWERLRGRARWMAEPGERFISGEDVRASRWKV